MNAPEKRASNQTWNCFPFFAFSKKCVGRVMGNETFIGIPLRNYRLPGHFDLSRISNFLAFLTASQEMQNVTLLRLETRAKSASHSRQTPWSQPAQFFGHGASVTGSVWFTEKKR